MLRIHPKTTFFTTTLCTALLVGSMNITSAQAASAFINVVPATVPAVAGTDVTVHGCNGARTECQKSKIKNGRAWKDVCAMGRSLAPRAHQNGNPSKAAVTAMGGVTVGLATNYVAGPPPSWGRRNPKLKDCCNLVSYMEETTGTGVRQWKWVKKSPLPSVCKGKKKKRKSKPNRQSSSATTSGQGGAIPSLAPSISTTILTTP